LRLKAKNVPQKLSSVFDSTLKQAQILITAEKMCFVIEIQHLPFFIPTMIFRLQSFLFAAAPNGQLKYYMARTQLGCFAAFVCRSLFVRFSIPCRITFNTQLII
jgi:hypothetical protein